MIAVIGGGIGGLAVGHHLVTAGLDATVLEASPRAGGVIHTHHHDGQLLESGPQRTRLTPPLRHLVADLGLESRLLLAPPLPLHIYTDGRLRRVPRDLRGVLATDLIGWPDRARALLEPLTDGLRPEESAAGFFTRKFGARTYRRVLAPLFGGLFASDPTEMRARHALASMLSTMRVDGSLLLALVRGLRRPGSAPACSFDGGLQTLVDALARTLGDRLRLGTPARGVVREHGRFRVLLDHNDLVADHIVLACPSAAAARILALLDPTLATRLGGLRLNRLATVHLESSLELGASGYQLGLDEDFATHGVTSQHDLFGRVGLYTAFVGGARRRSRAADLPDGRVASLAAAEFEAITGRSARVLAVHRTAIPAWDASWDALDGLELPPGIDVCANWRDRPGITGRLLDARRVASTLGAGPGSTPASPARTGTARSPDHAALPR